MEITVLLFTSFSSEPKMLMFNIQPFKTKIYYTVSLLPIENHECKIQTKG